MKLKFVVLGFVFLFLVEAQAENKFFLKLYTGIVNARFCGLVQSEDLKGLPHVCEYPLFAFNEELFEWSIFQTSAERQLKKNLCIRQKMDAILDSKKLTELFIFKLIYAWLGKKKGELITAKCDELDYNSNPRLGARININFEPTTDARSADPKQRERVSEKIKSLEPWVKLCSDSNAMAAIRVATKIHQYALPKLSMPELFAVMDEVRSVLVSKKTGKPVSDLEILNQDLSKLDAFEVKRDQYPKMKEKFQKIFDKLGQERQAANKHLLEQKRLGKNYFDLDEGTRDYLVEDGTVREVLEKAGKLQTHRLSGEDINMTTGAKCLLNHYEQTSTGEIVEGIVYSAMLGGVISQFLKVGKIPALLNSVAIVAVLQGLRETIKTCSADEYLHTKLMGQCKDETAVFDQSRNLPKDFGFKPTGFTIPSKDIPACKGLDQNSIVGGFERFGCITNSILSFAPMKLALPILSYEISK